MGDPGVAVRDLTRTFVVYERIGRWRRRRREVRAVDGISFDVQPGELCGYLGPNGAGKSTTVKMLTGILTPTSGQVRVCGLEPSRQRLQLARRIGVVFGQRTQLWWDLPLKESFSLLAHVYAVPRGRHRANVAFLSDVLDLGPLLSVPVRQLSLGQRMRADLAAALLHDPQLVYLDEPTIGLDVVSKQRVREFLATVNRERGVTVMLTTHDLADIERLCRRVMVIDRGIMVHDGSLEALREKFGTGRTLVVDLVEPHPPLHVPPARTVRVDGVRQWIAFSAAETSASAVIADVAAQAAVRDLTLEETSVEEVVRRVYLQGASDRSPDANRGSADVAGDV